MQHRVAALFAAFALIAGAVADCTIDVHADGGSATGVVVNAPTTAPDPCSFKFNGTGKAAGDIGTGAELEVKLALGSTQLLDKTVSACGDSTISLPLGLGSVAVTGITCPVSAGGDISVGATVTNAMKPPGKITGSADFRTAAGDTIIKVAIGVTP